MNIQDPVCGMQIDIDPAFAVREHMGQKFYFCSQSCLDQFDKDPHRYMTSSVTTGYYPERALSRTELPVNGSLPSEHVPHLEMNLRVLPGVIETKVNAKQGNLDIVYEPVTVDLTSVVQVVKMARLDVGTPHSFFARLSTRLMHGLDESADDLYGRIPHFIAEAGFEPVTEVDHFVTVFGPLSLWRAVKGK